MKQKTVFACQECGAQAAKWLGRCPECGAWNSMVEERPVPAGVTAGSAEKRYALASAAGPQLYADIDTVVAERLSTGIVEFDRVLGGGVVPTQRTAHEVSGDSRPSRLLRARLKGTELSIQDTSGRMPNAGLGDR